MLVEETKNAKRMGGLRGSEPSIRVRITPAMAVSLIMLIAGSAALAVSVLYSSSTLALVGLGLAFWGALLLYIRPDGYTGKTLLNAVILPSLPSLDTLNQMIEGFDYAGDAVYLPPRYFANPETIRIYVAKQKVACARASLPKRKMIRKKENRLFVKNPEGLLLTPPSAELVKIFEKTLGTSFTREDLYYVQKNMPKLFIKDLEIAENFKMEILPGHVVARASDSSSHIQSEYYAVHVRITEPICRETCEECKKLTHVRGRIGCPICSSIACALTKATSSPVMIESVQASKDGKTIEVTYGILGVAP
jgi:hypothetical protein